MLPTLVDISPSNLTILDERTAYEHFNGKTIDEAVALFKEAEEIHVDDLVWMGQAGFDYYLDAYLIHLKSVGDSKADVCLAMHLVVTRVQMNRTTDKLIKLTEVIRVFGNSKESCDRQLKQEYEAIAANLRSRQVD
jgi:hypothetical protein